MIFLFFFTVQHMLLLREGLCAGVVQLVLMRSGDVQSTHCERQSVHSECVVCDHLREKMCQVWTEEKCGSVSRAETDSEDGVLGERSRIWPPLLVERWTVMSISLVSYNCHTQGRERRGRLSLSGIKSRQMLQQHVPEPKATPALKIGKHIWEICSFCWWRLDNLF